MSIIIWKIETSFKKYSHFSKYPTKKNYFTGNMPRQELNLTTRRMITCWSISEYSSLANTTRYVDPGNIKFDTQQKIAISLAISLDINWFTGYYPFEKGLNFCLQRKACTKVVPNDLLQIFKSCKSVELYCQRRSFLLHICHKKLTETWAGEFAIY